MLSQATPNVSLSILPLTTHPHLLHQEHACLLLVREESQHKLDEGEGHPEHMSHKAKQVHIDPSSSVCFQLPQVLQQTGQHTSWSAVSPVLDNNLVEAHTYIRHGEQQKCF